MNNFPSPRPRKRFGQNFLHDDAIIRRIVRTINPQPDERLVEIGPGKGAITEQLLLACPTLQVIELDRDLIPLLLAKFIARFPDFRIHQCDALKFDFRQLQTPQGPPLRIVGNLPYNISTPIIFHLLAYRDLVTDMHFMLQKEVVDRITAAPGTKAYGRLGVMLHYYCRAERLFSVPPGAFHPAPKVESAIVRLVPHPEPPVSVNDIEQLAWLVNRLFSQRRKMLRHSLKGYLSEARLQELGIEPTERPEQLDLAAFATLANAL